MSSGPTRAAQKDFQRAVALFNEGRLKIAEEVCAELLARSPGDVELALFGGILANRMGRFEVAIERLGRCVKLDPARARAHAALAYALEQSGRLDEAIASYAAAARADPKFAEAHNGLGIALHRQGRMQEAVAAFERAVAVNPRFAEARVNLGRALRQLAGDAATARRWPEAAAAFERAIGMDPGQAEDRVNLAIALQQSGRGDAALREMEAARKDVSLGPDARARLGALYGEEGDRARARQLMDQAILQNPGAPGPHAILAPELLRAGELERGWREYLYRPTRGTEVFAAIAAGRYPPPFPADLRGKDIVLLGEQGLGDILFFLRYAQPLATAGARLHVRADRRLEAPVRSALRVASWIGDEAIPPEAIALWMGDLPAWVRPLTGSDVAPTLRIAPLDERIQRMRARLDAIDGRTLAIAWQAGTGTGAGVPGQSLLAKEIAPEMLGHALVGTGAAVVSIQRHARPGSLEEVSAGLGAPVHDFSDANGDLEDMIALLALVEGYVGVSSTNAHLLAAAGGKGRILVPYPAEWRWQDRGDHSPWFPGFTVHRQERGGDWTAALADLKGGMP